jgi:hypothetical protein
MPATIVSILVVTLLLPGLALLFAIVIRLALRGAPRPPERDDVDDPPGPAA